MSKYWLSENFKNYVGSKIPTTKKSIKMYSKPLERIYTDEELKAQAGVMTKEEIISVIADYTQNNKLDKNKWYIVGYFQCDDGVVRVVSVDLDAGSDEWDCNCYDLDYWDAGREMLSRNPFDTSASDPLELRLLNLEKDMLKLKEIIKF